MVHQAEEAIANKGVYKQEDRKVLICDHCKKNGHMKDKFWILHPHLKLNKFREQRNQYQDARAHFTADGAETSTPGCSSLYSNNGMGKAMTTTAAYSTARTNHDETMKKSDLDALIKALKESGNPKTLGFSLNASHTAESGMNASHTIRPLVIDSGASHHMISDSNLITNVKPVLGNVMIANGDKVPIRGVGELKLLDKVSKALYMPTFASNLLSVKKVTTALNCHVTFTPMMSIFRILRVVSCLAKV